MSWLAIVFWILQNAPTLISLVRQIIDLIRHIPHADQLAYRAHIAKAIHSGNHALIEQTLHECIGAACPTELKTNE